MWIRRRSKEVANIPKGLIAKEEDSSHGQGFRVSDTNNRGDFSFWGCGNPRKTSR
jgi:hypothetical protein